MNIQGRDRYMQNTWYIWLVVLAWIFLLYLLDVYKRQLAPLFKMLEALFELFVPLVVASIIDRGCLLYTSRCV